MILNSPFISGSLTVTGNTIISGSITAPSGIAGTASYASNAELLDGLDSTSFAKTGSNAFSGSQTITGSLTATGTIVAQTLVVQTVTSSVVYSSGSNVFGNNSGNNHQFTGSVLVSGSGYINGNVGVGSNLGTEKLFVSNTGGSIGIGVQTVTSGDPYVRLYDGSTIKADIWWGRSGNYMGINSTGITNTSINPNGGSVGIGTTNPSGKLHVVDYIIGTCTTSYNGDGIRTYATTTGGPGSQPGIGYWTAAGSKRFIAQLDVTSDTWAVVNATGINHLTVNQSGSIGIGAVGYSSTRLLVRGQDSTSSNWGFIVEDSGTNQIFGVRNDGRIGILTGAPLAPLHIVKDGTSGYSATTYASSGILISRTNGGGEQMGLRTTGASQNGISGTNYAGQILSDGNNIFEIYTTAGSPLVLGTTAIERMRITGGGVIGIGNNAPNAAYALGIKINGTTIRNGIDIINNYEGMSAAGNAFSYYNAINGIVAMQILGNGNLVNYNNSYGAISDVKLKENITDATSKLNDIMQLKIRNFNFKSDPSNKQIGFIAQEFEEVFPSLIEETPDRDENGNNAETTTKTIKTSVLIPILTKAIQELSAKNDALEARLAALETA